jgi:hypothetical protein
VGAPEAEAGPSTLKRKITPPDLAEIAQKKHRFNDTAYLEQSREINDNVRNAVTAGESSAAVGVTVCEMSLTSVVGHVLFRSAQEAESE